MVNEKEAIKVIADEIIRAVNKLLDNNNRNLNGNVNNMIANTLANAPYNASSGNKNAQRIIGSIDKLATISVHNARINVAQIQDLYASYGEFLHLVAQDATIEHVDATQLKADVADIISLSVQMGNFDFARVQDLVASALIIREAVGGTVTIDNLAVTNATFVSATIGDLVLKSTDGNYYSVIVSGDGIIHTEEVTVTEEEIISGQTTDGRAIVGTHANIQELSSQSIHAQSAIISDIFTDALQASKISAIEAFLASATIPELYATSITAIGNDLDLRANESINLIVGETLTGYKRYYLSQPASVEAPSVPTENPPEGKWVDIEPDYSTIGVKNHFGPNTNPTPDAYLNANGEVVSADGWHTLKPEDFPEFSGKNLIPLTLEDLKRTNDYNGSWDGNEYTDSGVIFTVNTNEYGAVTSIVANGTATQYGAYLMLPFNSGFPDKFLKDGEDYILSGCIGGSKQTYYINMTLSKMEQGAQSVIEIYSTDGDASFTYDSSYDPLSDGIAIYGGYTANNVVFYPMVRRAGEDDTFEPYENAIFKDTLFTDVDRSNATYYRCVVSDQYGRSVTSDAALLSVGEAGMPIVLKHPTDVYTLISIGKNKFGPNETPIEDGYINSGGSIITGQSGSAGWTISDYIPVTPETDYYFKPNTTAGNSAKHAFYTEDLTYISTIDSGAGTFTTPSNCHYMRFSYRSTSESIQLELGTSATTYEEYSSTGSDVNIAIKVANASSYQWQYKPVSGETWYDIEEEAGYSGFDTNELAFNADGLKTMRVYKCVVTNEIGSVETNSAEVLFYSPIVSSQPSNVFEAVNTTISFYVTAENASAYQWQTLLVGSETWQNTLLNGYNTSTLQFDTNSGHDGCKYRCIVTNGNLIDISDEATLTINTGQNAYISSQPESVSAVLNEVVTFSVVTENAVSYMWQLNNDGTWGNCSSTIYPDRTTDTLTVTMAANRHGWLYRCSATGGDGTTIYSEPATLNLLLPIITEQPENITAEVNSTVQFTVEADNVSSYQWQYMDSSGSTWGNLGANNANYSGGTTKTVSFVLTRGRSASSRKYRCVLTNSAGSVYTNEIKAAIDTDVYIIRQPVNFYGVLNDTASFTVEAGNVSGYRWQVSKDQGETWENLGADDAYTATYSQTLSTQRATWLYRCRMNNSLATTTYFYTDVVAMVIVDNISIITQPADQEGEVGDVAAFTVTATGTEPLIYRWQVKDSFNVSDYIEVLSDTDYYFQPNSYGSYIVKHAYYDEDFNLISTINSGPVSFTTPEGCFYMRFSYRITSYDIQLEYGNEPTTYEEYADESYNLYYVDLLEYAGNHEPNWSYTDVYLSGGYEAAKGAIDAQATAEDAYTGVQTLGDSIDKVRNAVGSLVVGGVNLVDNSDTIIIEGTGSNSYYTLATGLSANTIYTLSMESATLVEGTASSMTIEVIRSYNSDGSTIEEESSINTYVPTYEETEVLPITALNFSAGKQSIAFITANDPGTYTIRIYAGTKGSTTGVTVELRRVKLEVGMFATMWTESQDDLIRRLEQLQTSLNVMNNGVKIVTTRVIGEYTTDEYGNLIKDGNIYSDASSMDGQLTTIEDFFEFDTSVAGDPKLRIRTKKSGNDDSSIGSNMYMELGKTSLNFYLGATKVAYFTDNKLHVTNVEAKERVSIGTDSNGFLDIYTTSGGVAFVWRS